MYIEMTRLVPVEDLPAPLLRFLRAFPNLVIQASVDANVDKPHQDWAIRFTWLGENIKLCYSDRPDLGMWCEAYPFVGVDVRTVPTRDASPEDWAAFVITMIRLKLERDLSAVQRKLDCLHSTLESQKAEADVRAAERALAPLNAGEPGHEAALRRLEKAMERQRLQKTTGEV